MARPGLLSQELSGGSERQWRSGRRPWGRTSRAGGRGLQLIDSGQESSQPRRPGLVQEGREGEEEGVYLLFINSFDKFFFF